MFVKDTRREEASIRLNGPPKICDHQFEQINTINELDDLSLLDLFRVKSLASEELTYVCWR